jgi:adenylate cyclase
MSIRPLEAGGNKPATISADEARRLAVLAKVAETVTEDFSLDHQLPHLIHLIADALDAERATLFLHDAETSTLFSRVVQGEGVVAEIRIPDSSGISGAVFQAGIAEIVPDAYEDPRFNRAIDLQTGYRTRGILCVPLRNRRHEIIGVTQVLNKRMEGFRSADLELAEAINRHASSALEQAMLVERLEQARREETELLAVAEAISTELNLDILFARVIGAARDLLKAERATLFIYDSETDELWSKLAEGTGREIRIPASAGLAGAAFTSGELVHVPDAYADPRFNQAVDRLSGFRTRNILSMPITDRESIRLGVMQVLNKRSGAFTSVDIRRLRAFSAEIAVAIQNAKLFSDVLALKNYNESVLKSLSNGVVTLDQNFAVVKVNEAAQRILDLRGEAIGQPAGELFGAANPWVMRSLDEVASTGDSAYVADADFVRPREGTVAVNLTTTPLADLEHKTIGYMLVVEDLTREKRVRNTMSRYMAKEVVDRLLASGDDVLHGTSQVATVLFSDIRSFTTLSERMSPRETVALLNDYFTEMVEVVLANGGMLDKYMGDGMMATFGAPVADEFDADNALLVATEMVRGVVQFNERRHASSGAAPIAIGVGLATGEVLAGSVGSRKRMEYTVIGDNVNLASRLESANKYYGSSILLPGATADALKSRNILRQLDLIRVKGKNRPTLVYEALGHHTPNTFPHLAETVRAYEAGFAAYRQRDWDSALSWFSDALELTPFDKPSHIFLERCRYYRDNPPPDEWDGVWIMEEK